MRLRYLGASVVAATALAGVVVAPPAAADCNYSGGTTLCASGDVRGGSSNGSPPSPAAPYSPYPCYDYGDPLCLAYDNYDPGIIFDPPNVIVGGGRPVDPGYGRPGVGGGNRPGAGGRRGAN